MRKRERNEAARALLNELLTDELTTISQYTLWAHMCDHWGYEKLHEAMIKQAKDEARHADMLVKRIMVLGCQPAPLRLNPIRVGKTAKDVVPEVREVELASIREYNVAISLAKELGDDETAAILNQLLNMERGHEMWANNQLPEIEEIDMESHVRALSGTSEI